MFNFVYDNMDFAHKYDEHTLPSDDFTKHMHDHYELLYVVRGDIHYTIDSQTKRLGPGDTLLIPPGALHFGTVNPAMHYERFVLKFSSKSLHPFIMERIKKCKAFCGRISGLDKHFAELDRIYDEYCDEERYILMMAVLMRILIQVYHTDNDQPQRDIVTNEMIAAIIKYIDANTHRQITLEDICNELHFSKSYISSEFSKEMKTPVMNYIKTKKIIAAHRMITETDMSIADVARQFGYNEYSTFYRNYLKIIGFPPQKSKS